MNFQNPYFLGLILLVPILWFLGKQYQAFRQKGLQAFGSDEQLSAFAKSVQTQKFVLFLLGLFLLAISATNPRMKGEPVRMTKKGGDVVFALDVSKSMLAEDVKPSRLERAKLLCLNLLQGFDNQRVAVVVFAGDAYVTMPFSTNYEAVATFVDEANTEQVSAQGSDYSNLIETLIEFFGKDKLVERGVVVLSDGEDHSQLSKSDIRKANKNGLIFLTVGIGTRKGAPIPSGRSYLENNKGEKVITKLHRESLVKLAGSNGKYFAVSEQRQMLAALRRLKESHFSDMTTYQYSSFYQYLLLPGLLLIGFSFFRGR